MQLRHVGADLFVLPRRMTLRVAEFARIRVFSYWKNPEFWRIRLQKALSY